MSNKTSKKLRENEEISQTLPKEISSLPDEGWVRASELADFLGPVMIIAPGDKWSLLRVEEENGQIKIDDFEGEGIPEEPASTANVLVGQSLIPGIISFKSAYGKYLTTDSLGQVFCNKEAVSPLAEWTLILKPDGTALQSVNQKFLSFDPISGKIRCDSETIGFNETFIVKCQAARRKDRLIQKFKSEKLSNSKFVTSERELAKMEENEAKKMQSYGYKSVSKGVDLKRAAEEGSLRETLLERRIKSKHDPFC